MTPVAEHEQSPRSNGVTESLAGVPIVDATTETSISGVPSPVKVGLQSRTPSPPREIEPEIELSSPLEEEPSLGTGRETSADPALWESEQRTFSRLRSAPLGKDCGWTECSVEDILLHDIEIFAVEVDPLRGQICCWQFPDFKQLALYLQRRKDWSRMRPSSMTSLPDHEMMEYDRLGVQFAVWAWAGLSLGTPILCLDERRGHGTWGYL